jgi:hypothetical protein
MRLRDDQAIILPAPETRVSQTQAARPRRRRPSRVIVATLSGLALLVIAAVKSQQAVASEHGIRAASSAPAASSAGSSSAYIGEVSAALRSRLFYPRAARARGARGDSSPLPSAHQARCRRSRSPVPRATMLSTRRRARWCNRFVSRRRPAAGSTSQRASSMSPAKPCQGGSPTSASARRTGGPEHDLPRYHLSRLRGDLRHLAAGLGGL